MLKRLLLASTGLFLLFVGTAHAGPLIGGIGALVGSIGAGGLSLGSIAIGVASMAAQWLLSTMLAPEQKQRGIKTRMETGGDNPPTFIIGEYATAGQLIYANTLDKGSNIPEACLVYVICLSALPVTSVSNRVFINNEGCTIDEESSWGGGFMEVTEYVKGGDDGGYCLMKFHLGDQNSADDWLMDKFGNDPDRPWNNDMFLPGCAYAIVQAWYSNRGIWTGLPEFRFQVRGLKLYDPRKDSTQPGGSGSHRWNNQNTWEFTKNPKVIEYNFHRGIYWDDKHQWGGKAEEYRLPLDYWFTAMNTCDETVVKKNDEEVNRYEIGGEISFDDKPIDVITEINKSCSGYTTEFGGTYKTWVGGPGLSVGTITDDDFAITADMETSPFQPRQNTFNTCYPSYPEPKQQWEVKDAPRFQDEDALNEDGEELPLDLPLPFVSENNQVQRIARLAIKDSRRQVTHAGQLPPVAWVYEPFDRLTYNSTQFGYTAKDFIVASKDDLPNVMQQILLREWVSSDTGWLPEYEADYDFAPLTVVKPGDLELDLDVYADQVESASGKDKPAIRAEWTWGDGIDLDVRRVDWQIRRAGQTKVIAEKSILNPADGEALIVSPVLRWGKDYEIRFRPRPFAIRDSLWTEWKSVTMLAVEVPANLNLTAVSDLGKDGKLDFFVVAEWDDVAQETNGYGVKITIGGEDFYHRADGSRYKFPVKAPSSVTVAVRTRASDGGTASAYCDPETISVTKKGTAPTTPTELTVIGKHRRAVVKTEDHPDDDFRRWCVYYSKTNDFTTATKSKHSRSNRFVVDDLDNGDTYYFWLTAEDTSGNESAKYPSSNTAGVSATMAKIDDDDTESSSLAAPTGLTLTKVQDTDEDGSVRTFIKMTCTAPGWATSKTTYVFAVTVGSDTYTVKSDDETARYRVNKTGVLHTVKVRAIKGHGNKGSWSSDEVITPSKKLTLPTTASGLTVVTKPQKNIVKWTKSADADYLETAVLRSTTNNVNTASEIGRVAGTRLVDDEITKGTTYYYWAIHYNRSAASASAPTSANGSARGVEYADADNVVLSAPTGLTLTQANKDVDLDGTVDIALLATFSGPIAGASNYEFEFSWASSSGGTYTVLETKLSPTGKAWFKANTTRWYKVRVRAINWDGTLGTWSSLTSAVQPAGTAGAPADPSTTSAIPTEGGFGANWAAPSEFDYDFSEIAIRESAGTPTDSDIVTTTQTRYTLVYHPWYDYDIYVYARHVNTSGLKSGWVLLGGAAIRALPLVRAQYNAGGTGGASITIASSAGRSVITGSWRCTSNTAGVTVTIGTTDIGPVDFIDKALMSYTVTEETNGVKSLSKTGGTWAGARIDAIVTYDT